MDSFKDSIDTTLATKADEVATAASQSADLIKKRKKPWPLCTFVYCFFVLFVCLFDSLDQGFSR